MEVDCPRDRLPASMKNKPSFNRAPLACVVCYGHGMAEESASYARLLFVVLSGFHQDPGQSSNSEYIRDKR